MKNRRNIIVAFLLCATLLVGVGYAALTDVLDITGKADINHSDAEAAFNEDIYWSGAQANQEGNTASVNTNDNDKASFTVSTLKGAGDTATFTFTIFNNGDLDAVVTPSISSNTKMDYFGYSSDWNGQPKTLKAGQSLTYTVTVELLQTPQETISGSCIIELTAVSTETTAVEG